MSRSTPEKIGASLNDIEKDISDMTALIAELDSVKSRIMQALARSLDRFEDVPIERLRKIRPMIEAVQSHRDRLIDSSQKIEDFSEKANDMKHSIEDLRKYYDDQYMASVNARANKDR